MQIPPPSQTTAALWCRRILALIALSLLAGCANGDFNEIKPFLVRDSIHDWVGPPPLPARTLRHRALN
jgi:hypothetical protein